MAAHGNTCACPACSGIRSSVDQIFRALEIYGWLLDAYVVDFFHENLWSKLPNVWKSFLDEVTPEELGKWILRETGSTRVWPLSLLALRQFVESAEINRDHKKQAVLLCSSKNFDEKGSPIKNVGKCSNDNAAKEQFVNLFTKHVKMKKRHEIDVISKIAADCALKAGCECIVDIGAGMGHLARVLAYKHNLCVTCVEQNQVLLEGARKWDEQLSTSLAKHIPDFRERKPQHVSLQLGVSAAASRQLADQLACIFTENFGARDGFGLIGLHPCGDLAATLLRFYATEEKARFICIVGCCYMKLTLSQGTERGYPMSQHLLSSKKYNYKVTYAALEVACHAIEKHCDKLKTNNYSDLIVHAYRAVLECLLIEKNSELRRTQLKNTKSKEDATFEHYCKTATENLEPNYRPIETDYKRSDVLDLLSQWKRVLVFGSLRLLLAPLVETLVLYDRFLYLSELNLSPALRAEFDARVSPRNFVLLSIKQNMENSGELL